MPRGSSGGRTSTKIVEKAPNLGSAKQNTRIVGEPPAGTLHVRIRDNVAALGEETYFKVKWSTRMERVFQAYAVRKRSSLDTLRFRLPGADRDVGMDETSTSLGLEDLALIDCFAKEPEELMKEEELAPARAQRVRRGEQGRAERRGHPHRATEHEAHRRAGGGGGEAAGGGGGASAVGRPVSSATSRFFARVHVRKRQTSVRPRVA